MESGINFVTEYIFIENSGDLYEQSVELRYDEFYKNFNRPKESIFDNVEEEGIRVVAVRDNKVIGHIRAFIDKNYVAEITHVVVHHNYRGMDIGKNMMNKMIEKLKEHNVKSAELDSRIYAIKFYEKLGFNIISEVFISKKSHLPHVRMEKIIKD